MTDRAVHSPFRWAIVNADGHEYLIGQGPFGDEFVKVDGDCVRRFNLKALRARDKR